MKQPQFPEQHDLDVSVIIVTYNSAECLRECLASVAAQTGVTKEIIVVDNASSDGTLALAKTFNVRTIENRENVGYGRANNQGFAVSSGRFIYLLNPDSQLTESDALARLCRVLESHPAWGMAGTRVRSADGRHETLPSTGYPAQRHVRRDFSKLPGEIAWVIGASMFFRRAVYAALGGFDPEFFLYSEETDLGLRLRELGHEIGHVTDVTVRHLGGASEKGSDPYEVCRRKMTGILRFRHKHYSTGDAVRLARRDFWRAWFRMVWHGWWAVSGGRSSKSWRKRREYQAIREISRQFLVSRPRRPAHPNFLERTREAKKVMVLDLGFLGDTVHLLPALWMVRQAYPKSELHVTVAEHIKPVMNCVPWLDRVWGYPRFPKHATLGQNFRMISRLRSERFDALINLNGSDRSSWLTFLSGAPERFGRMPEHGGPPFWRNLFTDFVHYPVHSEPIYVQRCRCLEKAGFPFTQPEFHVETDPAHLQTLGISPADVGTYFHLSPFTTADRKELAPEQMVELLIALQQEWPEKRWIISSAPTKREQEKLDALLRALPWKPWKSFSGKLELMPALIRHSALHLSGDTGMRHVALMTETPSVAWFRPFSGMVEWIPTTGPHRTLVGNESDPNVLRGIETADLVKAVRELLQAPRG